MSSPKRERVPDNSLFRLIGILFLFFGVLIFVKIYYPVASAEINYQLIKSAPLKSEIVPVDPAFSIVIPKLNINSKVIKNVDPFNSRIYQKALSQGVAHAKGSGLPGFPGNVFIFAHSASSWYQANQFNAVFYLIDKLEPGDQIYIYYENSKYLYTVAEKKLVKSTDINYLSNNLNTKSLTLMTCWPPGTTLKRLVIIANSN
jgi:sortase A